MQQRALPSERSSTSLRSRFSSLSLKVKKVFAKPPAASAAPAPSADSVLTLPLDVVALIVDAIRKEPAADDQRRAYGLSIALVCKDWRLFGEGLIWANLDLNSPEKARRAAERFKAGPALATGVRELTIRPQYESIEQGSSDEAKSAATQDVLEVLEACTSLYRLCLFRAGWYSIGSVLDTSAAPSQLTVLAVRWLTADLSPPILIRFLASFPQLRNLSLFAPDASSTVDSALPAVIFPLRLFMMRSLVPSPFSSPPTLFSHLLSSFDPHTLQDLHLCADGDDLHLLDRIFAFTSLVELAVYLPQGEPEPFLRRLWHLASRHPRSFSLRLRTGDRKRLDLPETPDLTTFLQAVPSTINSLSLRGIYLQVPHISEDTEEGPFARAARLDVKVAEQRVQPILFGQSQGSTQWVRMVKGLDSGGSGAV